jgi:hypothetical protein
MLTDPFADNWLDALQQDFRSLTPAHKLHLLIDGAFVPGLHRRIAAGRKALLFDGLPGSGPDTLDVSPFILSFDPDDGDIRNLLLKCRGWPMVNVIETPEPWRDLAARLAAWCVIEADGQRFNFRFADTRRLPAILKTLTKTQRGRFAGPATCWRYMARHGAWEALALDGSNEEIASDPQLDDAQFGALVEDSRADEVLARLRPSPGRGSLRPSQAYALIASALTPASDAGLSDNDISEWCDWLWQQSKHDEPSNVSELFLMWRTHALGDGGRS